MVLGGAVLVIAMHVVSNRLVLQDLSGTTANSWDSQSRLLSIWNPYNERTTITWDSLDRESHRVLGNGGAISHTFDSAGRETLIENRDKNGGGQFIATNTYSATNNRLTVLELDNTRVTFAYDASSQLISEARSGANAYNTSYVYDPNSNRVKKYDSGALTQYSVNAANELLVITPPSGAATTQTFDPNGNTLTAVTGAAITTNTWTGENRLSKVAFSDGTSESYEYKSDGLRTKKTNGSGTTLFTWDESNVLLETDNTLALQARYTDYPGYWGGLASQRRGATSSYYGFDSQGSTRILVSQAGVITDSYSFKANGEILNAGSGTVNPFIYIGLYGYYEDRTDVYYVRARIDFADIARWISRDPIGFEGGSNPYGYAWNEPVWYVDPAGLSPETGLKVTTYPDGSAHFVACGTCELTPPYGTDPAAAAGTVDPGLLGGIMGCLAAAGVNWPVNVNQGLGADPTSAKTHYPDYCCGGKMYSCAVDLSVPGFHPTGGSNIAVPCSKPTMAYDPICAMLKALRNCGFPAWYRWGGERGSGGENEIHLIDPQCPCIKKSLQDQIDRYKQHGNGYPKKKGRGLPKDTFLPVTDGDVTNLRKRIQAGPRQSGCSNANGSGPCKGVQ